MVNLRRRWRWSNRGRARRRHRRTRPPRMEREYRAIDPTTARVILIQSGSRILPTFAPPLSAPAERSLRELGVDVRLDVKVREVDAAGVAVGEQRLAARTVLWAAGVAASPAAQWLDRPSDAA